MRRRHIVCPRCKRPASTLCAACVTAIAEETRHHLRLLYGDDHGKACGTASRIMERDHGLTPARGYIVDRWGQRHMHQWALYPGATGYVVVDPLADEYDGPIRYEYVWDQEINHA